MFNSAKLNSRLVAAALGALAIGTFAFSGSAAAAPVQLFPFIMTPADAICAAGAGRTLRR